MQKQTKRRAKAKKKWREKVVDFAELVRNKLAPNGPKRERRRRVINK
jgi:hypothetical protein